MNWQLFFQGVDTAGIAAILLLVGSVYREHKIMWKWFEENQIAGQHRRARSASAD